MNANILPSSLHTFFSRGRMPGFEQVIILKLCQKYMIMHIIRINIK